MQICYIHIGPFFSFIFSFVHHHVNINTTYSILTVIVVTVAYLRGDGRGDAPTPILPKINLDVKWTRPEGGGFSFLQ